MLVRLIIETEPQPASAAFTDDFTNKLTYSICIIPVASESLLPLEHIIRQKLIPAVANGQFYCDSEIML